MDNKQLRDTIKRLVDDITELTLAVAFPDESKENKETNENIQTKTTDNVQEKVSSTSNFSEEQI